jgi:hypothetical protein
LGETIAPFHRTGAGVRWPPAIEPIHGNHRGDKT